MRKGKHALLAALGVVALAALDGRDDGAGAHLRAIAAIKAAWIYVGPHNDDGWSQAHDNGRLYVQKALGSKVETTYKENVPEGPQVAQVIESLIRDGNKIIFATSFGFQDGDGRGGEEAPGRVLRDGDRQHDRPKNMAEYFGAGEDSIYLSGMAAGAATKKGVIGYVVPFPIPEVIRHANAFALGAQAIAPEREGQARVDELVVRPDEGAEGRREPRRRRRGRDRPERRQPGRRPVRAVEGAARGSATTRDAQKFAPTSWLTAAVYDWGAVLPRSGSRRRSNGTWKTGFYYGIDQGRLHRHRPVRAEGDGEDEGGDHGEAAAADQRARSTSSRARSTTRSGKLRVPKGKRLTRPKDLYAIDWLVKGIERQPEGLGGASAPRERREVGEHLLPRSDALDEATGTRRPSCLACAGRAPCAGSRSGSPASSPTTTSTSRPRVGEVHALLGENGAGKTTLLEHPHRPLPRPTRARSSSTASPSRSQSPRDALDAGHRHGAPALPARRRRSPSPRTSSSATSVGRRRSLLRTAVERARVEELGERYGLDVDPRRADLAALGRRAAARRDPEGALPRRADPDPRRADRGAHAAGGGDALRDAPRDGRRGADGHLHLAQARTR